MTEKRDELSTLFLPRNFSVDAAERMRALVAGPPAYALRRRRIEELEAAILRGVRVRESKTGVLLDPARPPQGIGRSFSLLCRLVEAHNRYYPIEALLPLDPATGALLDGGKRWVALPVPTLADLFARSRAKLLDGRAPTTAVMTDTSHPSSGT